MTAYRCQVCATPLTQEQIIVARSRGYEPRYCSPRCRKTAEMRRRRAKRRRDA